MNNKMADILKLVRIQILFTVLFVFFKFIRPSILNSTSPEFFKKILLSLPNFFESVIGTLILTGIGLVLNDKLNKKNQIGVKTIYILAVLLAGIYVITQELKIHNIGGNNTFDQNDLIYSIIGLIIGYWIVVRNKPRIRNESIINDSETV